ncbi:Chaperone protein dnaJ 11 [Morus notabilis]|uniref:Chaperone protein dnaJ 11 n=1 Tax=Morus notabilis TaxID=981085 RepID=W9RWR6_9ROSA|nr:chaperone protein dnaJ 11, chloroplastic [Morus notabilis]EXC01000.1 Chaperone protein dnaJ 11 [Morus notabilis]
MISLTSSSSFFGPNVVVEGRRNPQYPSFRSVRPLTISASCASTVERPGSHIATGTSSLYEVLGIRMEATCLEIKTAYRRLARVVHPDVVVARGQRGQASADEFLKIHEAYSTLSDPEKRADYDRRLFERQWQANSRFTMSSSSSNSGFSSFRPRKWETDQCW